jgi:predicted CXXCH cytochrome family protein
MLAISRQRFLPILLVVRTITMGESDSVSCAPAMNSRTRAKYPPCVLILSLLILLAGVERASAVEHPGVVPKGADCPSCHAGKTRGTSVHSVATLCTVCHLTSTQGDMTTVSLFMPKEQICFACHEKNMEARTHPPTPKGQCGDCHDAHSSDQPKLLRASNRDSRTIAKK